MSGQGLYLAVLTPKEVVLLKLYVLRRDWHPATIKLFLFEKYIDFGQLQNSIQ